MVTLSFGWSGVVVRSRNSSLGSLHNAVAVEDGEGPAEEVDDEAEEEEPPEEFQADDGDGVDDAAEGEGLEAGTTFSLVGVADDS